MVVTRKPEPYHLRAEQPDQRLVWAFRVSAARPEAGEHRREWVRVSDPTRALQRADNLCYPTDGGHCRANCTELMRIFARIVRPGVYARAVATIDEKEDEIQTRDSVRESVKNQT